MTSIEVEQSGDIGTVRAAARQTLLDFTQHLKENGFLKYSYPMPDQERGEGWMIFLYSVLSTELIDSFGA
jgi:hypothetical protein